MADVTQLRFAQLLKKTLGLKANDPGRAVSPVIAASCEIQDAYQPENRVSRGEKVWGVGFQTTITTSTFPWWNILNPSATLGQGGTGKLLCLRRITVSFQTPLATTQPGQVVFAINPPRSFIGTSVNQLGNTTDSRVQPGIQGASCGYNLTGGSTSGTSINTVLSQAVWGFEINPVPAGIVLPQVIQSPDLDLIVLPGYGVQMEIQGPSLALAGWTWTAFAQCFERVYDPNELVNLAP